MPTLISSSLLRTATPVGSTFALGAQLNGLSERRRALSSSCGKRNTSWFEEKHMKTETHTERLTEPMVTRVALHPFLAGLNRAQLALLTDCAMAARFTKGQTILREGDFANRFYLIETGKVALESNAGLSGPVIIETIEPGDLLGWSWMFPPYIWQFTARVVESTTALFCYGTILREYCGT